MGDIADMMLEGILDEETGEYIGDLNEERFGDAAPGFPVSYERERRESRRRESAGALAAGKVHCPICGKRVKAAGLSMHMQDVHYVDLVDFMLILTEQGK